MIESKELFKIYCDISQFAEKDGIPKFKTPNFEITKFDCLVSVNLIFI
jgi:hypothetical protein